MPLKFWSAKILAIALTHNFVSLQAIMQSLKSFVDAKFRINWDKQLLESQKTAEVAKLNMRVI